MKKRKVELCKTGCGRRGKMPGWCSACYAKHIKGYFTSSGSISPEIIKKREEKQAVEQKRAAKRKKRELEAARSNLQTKLTPASLKVIADEDPGVRTQLYCDRLSFWSSKEVCYSRLFIGHNKKCNKCGVHDADIVQLNSLLEKLNGQAQSITAPENQIPQGPGTDHPGPERAPQAI